MPAPTTTRRRRLLVFSVCALLTYAGAALALDGYGRRQAGGRYDAIVVAGCRVMPNGRASPALRRRALLAAELYGQGRAPRVLLTGGVGDYPPSEARVAAAIVRAAGVPGEALLLEERSTSTEENARFAAARLGAEARVLVVSDAYHVFRAERVFRRHFRGADGTGTVAEPWPRWRGAAREVLALTAYALLGRLAGDGPDKPN
ncbi:MAG: YdcF family protein [Myxococcota bacterium]